MTLVLENVIQYTIKMALKDSKIEVDCWTDDFEGRKVEGKLNVTVSCTGCYPDSVMDCESILEQSDDEVSLEQGSLLGLLLSK